MNPIPKFYHELKIPRPSARIDIAVVNGELCGFEIKSDVDSLVRLPRQSRAFGAVFDRLTVVTTSRHLEAVKSTIPTWWGIVIVSTTTSTTTFSSEREATFNSGATPTALLHMLSRAELINLLTRHGVDKGLRSKRRSILIHAAIEMICSKSIHEDSRIFFKARAGESTAERIFILDLSKEPLPPPVLPANPKNPEEVQARFVQAT